jgi:hypothetical protein
LGADARRNLGCGSNNNEKTAALTLIADIPRGHGFQLQWAIRSRHKDWRGPLTTGVMKSD